MKIKNSSVVLYLVELKDKLINLYNQGIIFINPVQMVSLPMVRFSSS